jgi:chitinase
MPDPMTGAHPGRRIRSEKQGGWCSRHRCAGLAAAAMLLACGGAHAARPGDRVIGYVTTWIPAMAPAAKDVDTLIFAFAKVKRGRVVLEGDAASRLRQIVALKAAHPRLRVDVSVGGWGAGGFSEAARTAAGRATFAGTAARMVASNGADGLDIDWEYPGHGESGIRSSPDDRRDFTLLLKAVRASLDRIGAQHGRTRAGHYTLSVAIADGRFVSGIDIPAVSGYVDWFNMMTYDFCNAMTPDTCHHTGLFASKSTPPDGRTTARAVRQFLAAGVPPRKLIIGVAFYGLEFPDVRPVDDGLLQPYGGHVRDIPWPELKSDYIGAHGFARHWDATARAPWLWNPRTRAFISYDDPASIAAKAAFVKAHHLGGIMFWELGLDPSDELLDAIRRGLN